MVFSNVLKKRGMETIMKNVLLAASILLLILLSVVYVQFRNDITYAHQRVLEGSNIIETKTVK